MLEAVEVDFTKLDALAMAGVAYLVVRGFENSYEGFKTELAEAAPKIILRFLAWFFTDSFPQV